MRETGIVVSNQGKIAKVHIPRPTQCEGCQGCVELGNRQERIIEADNTLGAQVGDRVACEISTRQVLAHAGLVFILPLCLMIMGYLLATYGWTKEPLAAEGAGIAGALTGVLFAYLLIRFADRQWGAKHPTVSRITGYVEDDDEQNSLRLCPSSEQNNRTTR